MIGLVGKKIGMTRIFTEEGIVIPVTVIEVKSNRVTQIKNKNTDHYDAIQVTTGRKKNNRLKKPEIGHFIKSKVLAGIGLWEFRVKDSNKFKIGQTLTVDVFNGIKKVDVMGFSKGKGFSGTVKRWNFKMQDATHGNSLSHRAPGSIGQNQTPGRVFKGKKMSGHLGNSRVTIQNLDIVKIDTKKNLILLKGSVPGSKSSSIVVKPSIKE